MTIQKKDKLLNQYQKLEINYLNELNPKISTIELLKLIQELFEKGKFENDEIYLEIQKPDYVWLENEIKKIFHDYRKMENRELRKYVIILLKVLEEINKENQ